MNRRHFLRSAALAVTGGIVAGSLVGRPARAHHGWGWATDEQFELTGTITDVDLGNPHGEVTLDVDGQAWVVEVGQPWRNDRAGLTKDLLTEGTELTAYGHRSANEGERLMKAERVVIAGEEYNLYPDRTS